MVAFSAVVGGLEYEETKFLRFNDRNEVSEIVFYIRPLGALLVMASRMGPPLLRKNGRGVLAAVVTPFLRLLAGIWLLIDRTIVPFAGPGGRK